jgi:hypothetical protein
MKGNLGEKQHALDSLFFDLNVTLPNRRLGLSLTVV